MIPIYNNWLHGYCQGMKTKFFPKIPNHLIQEKSPYLLQHAYNPVDWYSWGEEAFQRARKELCRNY